MAERRTWEIPWLDRATAQDVVEAVERAGGGAQLYERRSTDRPDRWAVCIPNLPDVARFIRCLGALGITARVAYSGGSGWHFDFGGQPSEQEEQR